MITIKISNTTIEVQGHANSQLCRNISCLIQYICSCIALKLKGYTSGYGQLNATFEATDLSRVLLEKLVVFIKEMKTPEIYLEDRR